MVKKILFILIFLCLLAAASGPQVVSAGVDPLASPTPRATERITAPVISGVNPDAVLSEGNLRDNLPSDSFVPTGLTLPILVDPRLFVDPALHLPTQTRSLLNASQNIDDLNCGPSSLAQALQILEPEGMNAPPNSSQLIEFMTSRGLIYNWGTGIEELTYTAREFGFEGSIPFQNWNIKQLMEVLGQGRPVVVSLGMNGAHKPGHFVTLTGVSEDGKRIAFQDPNSGEGYLSREEFQSLWELQGSAGMIPQKAQSGMIADPMLPWMGLYGAISALALVMNQSAGWKESRVMAGLRKQLDNPGRKGIGAGPLPPADPEIVQIPRFETKTVYRGIKTVEVEVPVYETRKVKVGVREVKKKVPRYETRRVQAGFESVTKIVPTYTTKKIKTGTKLEKKKIPVLGYRYQKEMIWKKYTQRVPVYRKIGAKRLIIGYQNQTRWKRVPVTKKVPYKATKILSIEVPVYTVKKVISGYKTVIEKVPQYEQKRILAGYDVIQDTIPVFEERKIEVGTKTVTRQMPQYETVRILAGYDEVEKILETSFDDADQKIKKICIEDEKINELLLDRDYEVTDVVYLRGGPGAGFGLEKVENSYSGYEGGGGGASTPFMLFIKLLSRILVWIRDSTNILQGPGFKPDAQAIIMFSSDESQRFLDDIVVINQGYEKINVESIVIKKDDDELPLGSEIRDIYSRSNQSNTVSQITSGSFRVFPTTKISLDQDTGSTFIHIKLSTSSNRSGFLTYKLTK